MKPTWGSFSGYLTIQVTESHENTLIRRLLTPASRAQAFLVSIEGKIVLQLCKPGKRQAIIRSRRHVVVRDKYRRWDRIKSV